MGMMVLLLDGDVEVGSVDAATASRLVDLGVTSVSLLRDRNIVGVVLDGWAFDPALSGAEAVAAFGGARPLYPVLQTVLSPDATRHLPPITKLDSPTSTIGTNERSI